MILVLILQAIITLYWTLNSDIHLKSNALLALLKTTIAHPLHNVIIIIMSLPKTTKTMKSVKLRKICWTTFKCSIGKDFYVTTKKFKFCSHPSIIIPLSESFTRTKSSCLLVTMPMSSKISWNSSRFFGWAGNNFRLSLYMYWRTQVNVTFL